tara:strand:+ start:280 stop:1392 length:1113 start_codon:yes stop_codon:yes gene_type:complete
MKNYLKLGLFSIVLVFASCSTKDDVVECQVTAPDSFEFIQEGSNTVSYGGQTARLNMAAEILGKLGESTSTDAALLNQMYADGTGFSDATLDASGKQLRSKTASYQSAIVKSVIQAKFDAWLVDYASNVAPAMAANTMAAPGVAGYVGTRELNAHGFEIDQLFAKGLIGALCLDQVVNGYLSEAKIGDGVDNENRDPNEDANSTAMEHHWDEGYGYVYGKYGPDNSNGDLSGDGLLGKYLNKYSDHATTVFNAFKMGRQAIVDGCADERDRQAQIIKETLSKIIAIRADYYLRDAASLDMNSADYFHSLSEGYGFVMSLQFTFDAEGNPYFAHDQVNSMLSELESSEGFWNKDVNILINMADEITLAAGL